MIGASPEPFAAVDPLATPGLPSGPPPRWHLRVAGLEGGPVTWEVLRRLAGRGDLKPTDFVRRTDEDRWVPAAQARRPPPQPPAPTRPGEQADGPQPPPQSIGPRDRPPTARAAPPATPEAGRGVGRPADSALLALGLSLAGLIAFALPLGLLAVYLGGTSARPLARGSRSHLAVAVAAVAVGLADAGVSLWVLGGRVSDLYGHLAGIGR